MARESLGLFDTPPTRRDIRLACVTTGLLFAAFLTIFPFRNMRLPEVQPFVPVVDSITFVGEMIIGTLLYAQAAVFRSRALTVLASGYVFGTFTIIPHGLTFPGAFSEHGLLGAGVSTTAWLAVFWWWALPSSVIIYTLLNRAEVATAKGETPKAYIREGFFGAVILAALTILLVTKGHDLLPALFVDRSEGAPALFIVNFTTVALPLAAIVLLFLKLRSVLDMWLLVVLAGYLIQAVLNLEMGQRFTVGWYGNFGSIVFLNLIVMLVLLTEFAQLYTRLALSTAAQDREREARLMSMDGVAAAIAHEVGQPLAAVTLNARAGLGWLDREVPNPEMALASMQATLDAGHRTFEIIKSIRASFAKSPDSLSEVSLNDLLRETVALLDREMAAHRVLLEYDLDESLPRIFANRVQLQRVLANLLTNAMESVAATRRRDRLIAIRSAQDRSDILLEIRDSGIGIAQEELARIFDPFFTTKSTGTGLGLSLSKTIVDEHGGRLWATPGKERGVTFHLHLPRNRASIQ